MDRRERTNDPIEAMRAALDGRQAEIWTALPGLVESFDPVAMTVSVQPAVKGQMQDERGAVSAVNMPLLVDVPVVFPCGGGFSLTYPITKGDECLVVFASRCIDGWWQNGGVGSVPDDRMHDLSDGFAIIGPRSQARKLSPAVDTANVQLRTDDGAAHITLMPDYTIRAQNPACSGTWAADGTITAKNDASSLTMQPGGSVNVRADASITFAAPQINFFGAWSAAAFDGESPTTLKVKGDIEQEGKHTSTGDQIAGDTSQTGHTHSCPVCGSTGGPQ